MPCGLVGGYQYSSEMLVTTYKTKSSQPLNHYQHLQYDENLKSQEFPVTKQDSAIIIKANLYLKFIRSNPHIISLYLSCPPCKLHIPYLFHPNMHLHTNAILVKDIY
jgi:hypothetical protein